MIPRVAITPSKVVIGGSAASLLALIRAQRLSGLAVGMLSGTVQADGDLASVLGPDVDVMTIPMRGRPVTNRYGLEYVLKAALKAPALRTMPGTRVIQGHSGRWEYSLATLALARRTRQPWIQTLYCPVPPTGSGTALNHLLLRRTLSRANAVVGLSENVVASAERAGVPRSKLYHIDPCVDVERYAPSRNVAFMRRKLELPEKAQVILFVGNPNRSKGFDLLWDAFRKLTRVRQGVYLVATFEWHGRPWNDRVSDRFGGAATSNVRFLGVVQDMPSLMAACDALVLPFRDTFGPSDYPLPMLEAMTAGTSVVATDVGGISEVIAHEQTGILVPPDDSSALAGALDRTFEDAATRSRIVAAAREMIHQRFTPDVASKNWQRLYDTL